MHALHHRLYSFQVSLIYTPLNSLKRVPATLAEATENRKQNFCHGERLQEKERALFRVEERMSTCTPLPHEIARANALLGFLTLRRRGLPSFLHFSTYRNLFYLSPCHLFPAIADNVQHCDVNAHVVLEFDEKHEPTPKIPKSTK